MHVCALFVYPVKSLRSIAVETADVARRGLASDRRWMLVDDDGDFVTQRERPEMARIDVARDSECITLRAPGAGELSLPRALADARRRRVRVWQSELDAMLFEPGRAWLRRALGIGADLVYMPDDVERAVSTAHAGSGYITSFADAYPFLLISESSVEDLEQRAGLSLGVARFRPNIVVTGAPAYAEDSWARLRIGDVGFSRREALLTAAPSPPSIL